MCQPPPPKPNAWANEPKPPRLTDELDEEDDDDDDDDPPPDEESKKLLRDDQWPPLLLPDPDDELRGPQSAPGCGTAGAAMPGGSGWAGWQFCRGISA